VPLLSGWKESVKKPAGMQMLAGFWEAGWQG